MFRFRRTQDDNVEPECSKSSMKSNLRNLGEETPPKIKKTNPNTHEVVLKDSAAWTVIS